MQKIIYKVPGGKLMKIAYELSDSGAFNSIEIRGDFFVYPENGIEFIENFLIGKKVDEDMVETLSAYVKAEGIELFGFGPRDILDAFNQSK